MDLFRNICLFALLLIIPVESFLEGLRRTEGGLINDVQKMKISDEQVFGLPQSEQFSLSWLTNHKVLDYIKKLQQSKLMPTPKLVGAFSWNTCSKNATLLHLKNLSVSPDLLHFPGKVYFAFTAFIKKRIDAPLQLNLTLKKEITPTFWLKIPCIDGVGSCDIDDLCETLQGASCPMPFIKYDVPCKCPFNQGNYKMQKSGININVKDIPTGNYYLKLDASIVKQPVTCIEIRFTIV